MKPRTRFRWALKFHGPDGAPDLGSMVQVHRRPNREEGSGWYPLLFEAPRDWASADFGRFATLTMFDHVGQALEVWELKTDGMLHGDHLVHVKVLDGQCKMIDRDHPWQPGLSHPQTAEKILEDAYMAASITDRRP